MRRHIKGMSLAAFLTEVTFNIVLKSANKTICAYIDFADVLDKQCNRSQPFCHRKANLISKHFTEVDCVNKTSKNGNIVK